MRQSVPIPSIYMEPRQSSAHPPRGLPGKEKIEHHFIKDNRISVIQVPLIRIKGGHHILPCFRQTGEISGAVAEIPGAIVSSNIEGTVQLSKKNICPDIPFPLPLPF